MAKVITFINMKGGVGKTTLAVNVAYTLQKIENKKVLLIDMDPQMNATQYSLHLDQTEKILNNRDLSIYKFLSPEYKTNSVISDIQKEDNLDFILKSADGFDIIPSSLDIMKLHLAVTPFKLSQYIKEYLSSKYDVIIIDCPPTVSEYTKISLLASDSYVVPMKADPFAIFGLPILEEYIDDTIRKDFNHKINLIGIIMNMVVPNKVLYKKHSASLKEKWGTKILPTELRQWEGIAKAIENEDPYNRYILNLNNEESIEQIKNITKQIRQKGEI
ncbi:MAG: ParA family protein [Peptoanaerobacter stomatis]|uniref:ParA family protein n=1 Tax=Peptoanaerobacter stomatis TaxID=796937 RepID=UPI003F9FF93D